MGLRDVIGRLFHADRVRLDGELASEIRGLAEAAFAAAYPGREVRQTSVWAQEEDGAFVVAVYHKWTRPSTWPTSVRVVPGAGRGAVLSDEQQARYRPRGLK